MKLAKYTKWIGSTVLLMAVVVPTVYAVCSQWNGNQDACEANGCTYIPATGQCR